MPVAGVVFLYLCMQTPNSAFCRRSRAAAWQTRVVTPAGPGWRGGGGRGVQRRPPRGGGQSRRFGRLSERWGLAGCTWSSRCPGRGGAGEYPGVCGAAEDAAVLSSTGFLIFNVLLSSTDPWTLWLLFYRALCRHGLFYVWINAVLLCFLHRILYLLFPKMIWFSPSFNTHMIAISSYKIEPRNKRLNMLIMYIWFVFIVLRCVLIGSLPTSCNFQSVRRETCFILKSARFFPLSAGAVAESLLQYLQI